MEPEKRDEVTAWFQKAANDLRGADIDLAASPPLIEDALFHCQQAAEKALKGYLASKRPHGLRMGIPLPWWDNSSYRR